MFLIKRPDTHILEITTTEEMAHTVAEEKSKGGNHVMVWEHWLEQPEDRFVAQYFNGQRDL